MSSDYSDVTFIVEGKKLPAHRSILAARSSYFRALLYGGLAETTQREINLNVPLQTFKTLLRYVYSGCVPLSKMKVEHISDLLGLADEYGLETLKSAIASISIKNVSQKNCCSLLDAAQLYNLETLRDVCTTFMDQNATEMLSSKNFQMLSQESLCTLLDRDSFFAPEVEIFNAVREWYQNNPNADMEVFKQIPKSPKN